MERALAPKFSWCVDYCRAILGAEPKRKFPPVEEPCYHRPVLDTMDGRRPKGGSPLFRRLRARGRELLRASGRAGGVGGSFGDFVYGGGPDSIEGGTPVSVHVAPATMEPSAEAVRRFVPWVAMGTGLLVMALGIGTATVGAQSPSSVVAALQSLGAGTVTFSVTPVVSAPSGAWVSIMDPITGATFTHAFDSAPLVAGQSTSLTVPISLPSGTSISGFTSFVEIPQNGSQSVVLAAETQPFAPPPIPFVPPPGGPTPIPTVPPVTSTTTPNTSGTSSTPIPSVPNKVTLPKTGAGPAMEVIGVLLFLTGGLLLAIRPRRSDS